jgi:putative endonuclease
MNAYYTYIITNPNKTVLYVGVTNDLYRRMQEHREKKIPGFTVKYNVSILIWYDSFKTPQKAIAAEKRIKGWKREKKLILIKESNPELKNLLTEE